MRDLRIARSRTADPGDRRSRLPAQTPGSIAQRTSGMQRADGFIPFYWDASKGRILFEISTFDTDVLYFVSTAASPGSVELGMDRGVDAQKVVHFQRIGPKVLVVEQNLALSRAQTGRRH